MMVRVSTFIITRVGNVERVFCIFPSFWIRVCFSLTRWNQLTTLIPEKGYRPPMLRIAVNWAIKLMGKATICLGRSLAATVE
jgi:hypothetical protein